MEAEIEPEVEESEVELNEDEKRALAKEEKSSRLKALYQARMIIMRAGSPAEKIACSRAMRKMEKKYNLNATPKSDKRRNKNINKKLRGN